MKRPSSYKVTFLDRLGPAGMHRVKAGGYAAAVSALSIPALALMIGTKTWSDLLLTLVAALTLGAISYRIGMAGGDAAGAVAKYVTAGGSGTPYDEVFSQEQALVMQRDYATALHLFEQRILAAPNEPRVRVAAADLYMTHGENPKRAADLYKEVQRIPEVGTGHDIYVSNKLVDLYLGPLNERGKALVELRRLIERYPGSTVADHARLGLTNLKEDMLKDHLS
jgi:hypothetical protein